ncbi:extracellular solute-binding protein [bacterium 1xD8-6]|jgi:ABC-type sugar transport system, periplasmic component|nr:extracellular solute-binding protein [bacterium D16-36]RKI65100.1 extracellular solute-binding protein [bacterium 1xD8-6]
MRKNFKRLLAVTLTGAMTLSLAACGSKDDDKKKDDKKDEAFTLTLDQIKLGEDYTSVKADLKFLTHKTDKVDNTFQDYIKEFQKLYPNVNIEYEGITDYANDITTRLSTGDWGEICMVPTTVDKDELENYFVSFGNKSKLGESYDERFLNNYAFSDKVYGMPSMVNLQGIVYNKKVFEEAGVTELPKTPDEFLAALKKIKDNKKDDKKFVAPLYTNFAADWTMNAWDAYIDGGATGDADFVNTGLTKGKEPFSDRGDQTGPYAVYNTLYEVVKQGLTEEDPTTTDWEGSKGMINRGEIGCMVLGSWAIPQMQAGGDNADDIAYMPFPITVNGKQYAAAGPDYCYGINVNSSNDQKTAAMCYIKWLIEKSGFAESEGGITGIKGSKLPDALTIFDSIELVVNKAAAAGEETLFNDVNNDSELGINVSGAIPKQIVEEAIKKDGMEMKDMVKEWNEKWTTAQENHDIKFE